MASDNELPASFQKINKYGVPLVPLLVATAIPVILVLTEHNVIGLALLYAIGFVGAIATNFCATATNKLLRLKMWERGFMFFSFLILLAIEITLYIDKPSARYYALGILACGFLLAGYSKYFRAPVVEKKAVPIEKPIPGATLFPVRTVGEPLKKVIHDSIEKKHPVHFLFIREQNVITDADLSRSWETDEEAKPIMEFIKKEGQEELTKSHYSVSDSAIDIIAAYATMLDVKEIILENLEEGQIIRFIKGHSYHDLRNLLPNDVIITIYSH